MTMVEAKADNHHNRVVPAWRLVAGAYLHFAMPAYLIVTPLAAIFGSPDGAPIASILAQLPMLSGWFLGGYVFLALLSVAAAITIEPLLRLRIARREARDPNRAALASSRRVARAIADGTPRLGTALAPALDALRGPRWDHTDERFQALSADLAEVVRASSAALATAPAARRPAIVELTAASLHRIETALAALQAERGRLDEGDLHTVARYVAMRHDLSDFTSEEH
ncbi:hypothetical protein [Novosphingobium sp. Rr 2-17]|uniref:hypothetical protein n=1 Tax=Novosphingobium sp. Rr 2-17 TaxID=555793 RepID=UPI0012F645FD|nr:hypothetical protein [Novosphingobium sp. Rr 2-17]